jgi:NADH:ubiquinone oxidoreductase subunit F (NADH-binding)/NAD-dependent dihydropyrimidine dehydrogenase PreA subunit/(2Fe-2S) ferredoxin
MMHAESRIGGIGRLVSRDLRSEMLSVISNGAAGSEELLSNLRRETVVRPTIFIGTGTCGLGAGAAASLESVRGYLAEHDVQADIVEVGCIGLCSCEPLMDVQLPGRPRLSFKHVTADRVHPILEAVLSGSIPQEMMVDDVLLQFEPGQKDRPWDGVVTMKDHPFFGPQKRWVLENCGNIDPASVAEYVARGGYSALASTITKITPPEVCNLVEKSGLQGRGGGGFRTGLKWKFAHQAQSDQKYLICNADEGDPGAFMDRAVIEGDPHRLVEGMAIAAYAIGASKGYVYIRAEYPLAIARLKEAISVARGMGLLGHNILDSGFDFDIKIKEGAGAFVCGEETALINSIEGKRGMPRPRPPYPAVKGLFGKPTVINNVETLANLPILLRNGAEWFASVGTAGSKGTKVFALSGKVVNTGLVEIPMGTTIRDVVMKIGGGIPGGHQFKAVQIGGPSGGCVPEQNLDTEVDYESIKKIGAMMGSGGLVVMDENTCMVDLAKFFMDFIQRESCGKCIPCREGTRRMLEILQRITRGRRNEKDIEALERFQGVMYLERLGKVIQDTSLCGLGQTAPNPVLSTLRWFRSEYEEHIYDRKCRAGVCTELLQYSIDADKCIGCTLCARHCPADAIMGAPKSPHYIVPDKCIGCGTCVTDCRHGAVIIA